MNWIVNPRVTLMPYYTKYSCKTPKGCLISRNHFLFLFYIICYLLWMRKRVLNMICISQKCTKLCRRLSDVCINDEIFFCVPSSRFAWIEKDLVVLCENVHIKDNTCYCMLLYTQCLGGKVFLVLLRTNTYIQWTALKRLHKYISSCCVSYVCVSCV